MAVFEKDRGSRRYYSLSTDGRPKSSGGIPTGSFLIHTDTGDKFMYNGRYWQPFAGGEGDVDVLLAVEEVRDALQDMLPHIRVMRAALATLANDQSNGNYSTQD